MFNVGDIVELTVDKQGLGVQKGTTGTVLHVGHGFGGVLILKLQLPDGSVMWVNDQEVKAAASEFTQGDIISLKTGFATRSAGTKGYVVTSHPAVSDIEVGFEGDPINLTVWVPKTACILHARAVTATSALLKLQPNKIPCAHSFTTCQLLTSSVTYCTKCDEKKAA